MIFHLITIQNQNSDDTVFHGFDIAALRIQVVTYCRENWPHHITRDNGGMPDDEDILIEAYFYENEREVLIEQEFPLDLPDPPPRWNPNSHWEDHPDHDDEDWRDEVRQGNTRLGYHEWVYSMIESTQSEHSDISRP